MKEVLDWVRETCLLTCGSAYNDVLPIDKTNAVAVRVLTRDRLDKLNGDNAYHIAMLQVLYRGTSDRLASLNIAETMSENLNVLYNVSLATTTIIQCHSEAAVYGFMDDNQNINYSITIDLEYKED